MMILMFRRIRKWKCMKLMLTCVVLSVLMLCWEHLNVNVFTHVKSYSYRYMVNRFTYIAESFTISGEKARSFSNFPYLLVHPDKCTGEDVFLLLLVKSSPGNIERRNAIRSTWGNETYIQSELRVTVKVVFVLGVPQTKEEEPSWSKRSRVGFQEQLIGEDSRHGDLIQQDFIDTFHNLTLKLIMQFHWMHSHCPHAHFLMTADDDIFIHMPNLVGYLKDMRNRGLKNLWIGRVHRGSPPMRLKESKYYVPFEMYQWPTYPDYTGGAGYVVSSDIANKIYKAMQTLNASLYIDDVFMGICASAAGVSPQEHLYFSGEYKAPYHPCIYDRMMTSHGHVEDIHDLWRAATSPQVKERVSGLMGKLYCTAVRIYLLCSPLNFNTYPCKAAFV